MKTPCPHQATCRFKDQPGQCPSLRLPDPPSQAEPLRIESAPDPKTRWTEILEETLPTLPSW